MDCASYMFGLFQYALVCVVPSSAIILTRAGCLALIVSWCIVTISVPWLFLAMQYCGLQYVIVVFSDHTDLIFC